MADTSRPDVEYVPARRVRLMGQAPLGSAANVALPTLLAFSIVGALYVAQDVLIPFALAALLSFLFAPPVRGLRRLGLPQGGAVTLVMLGALLFTVSLGFVISSQARVLISDFPKYEGHIREKIRSLKDWESGSQFLDKMRQTASDLGREFTSTRSDTKPPPQPSILTGEQAPQEPDHNAQAAPPQAGSEPMSLNDLRSVVEPTLKPLGLAGLVMLFTVFILLQREDLRNRVIRLAGAGDLNRATVAMTDAAKRLSRFFILQASLNLAFGVFVAVALWGLDVPAALGFGLFSALMRFVPYIGSVLAALPPIAVAAAIEPGWSTALLVAAVFGIGEPLMGQVIEPIVFGRHTGLSPIAVVGAATFWTWLWGPIGLLLATPLTLCLVVMGQHTRPLRFLTVLLSDEPALSPPEVFYQRLLAGDSADVIWQAETALKSQSLVSYYDNVVLPGLRLASLDVRAGQLDDDRLQEVAITLDDLVETLGEAQLGVKGTEAATSNQDAAASTEARPEQWIEKFAALPVEGLPAVWRQAGAVVIYPGRGTLDFASARMAADLLNKLGFGVDVRPRDREGSHETVDHGVLLEAVASVGGLSMRELRFAVRRIGRAHKGREVIACAFASERSDDEEAIRLVRSFAELLSLVLERAKTSERASDGEVQRPQVALEIAAVR